VGRVFGLGGPPYGTIAHEAWREIQKLPGIMESSRARLLDADLDPITRRELLDKIERIEGQIARHMSELGDLRPGRGYIEMAGRAVVEASKAKDLKHRPLEASTFDDVGKAVQASYVFEAKAWSKPEGRSLPLGEYIYVLRDAHTGEILKVGKTSNTQSATSDPLDKRMGLYRTAAASTGRDVQVELHHINVGKGKAEDFEFALRDLLYAKAGAKAKKMFEWDNFAKHNEGRFGPGTPYEELAHDETVKVIQKKGTKILVEHSDDNKTRQWIETDRKGAVIDQPFDVPRRALYEWRLLDDGTHGIVYKGLDVGTRPALSPLQRLYSMEPAERRVWLEDLMKANGGKNISELLTTVGKEYGVTRQTMYGYLNPPFVDRTIPVKTFVGPGSKPKAAPPKPPPKPPKKSGSK
jgi:hypothetical protein